MVGQHKIRLLIIFLSSFELVDFANMCFTKISFPYKAFVKNPDSYKAIEKIIAIIKEQENIQSFTAHNIEYLYNVNNKTAILLKSISRPTQRRYRKNKTNRRQKVDYDIAKRITTVSVGINAIRKFFSEFNNFELVVPCGSLSHECCIFFRKDDSNRLDTIYYNPNYSQVHDGVESSTVVRQLLTEMKGGISSKRAFYSPNGNVAGQCSAVTWHKMFDFVCNGCSPFNDEGSLGLEDYRHHTTTLSYNRYQQNAKKKKPNILKHMKMWKEMDNMLLNASERKVIRISIKISQMLAELPL